MLNWKCDFYTLLPQRGIEWGMNSFCKRRKMCRNYKQSEAKFTIIVDYGGWWDTVESSGIAMNGCFLQVYVVHTQKSHGFSLHTVFQCELTTRSACWELRNWDTAAEQRLKSSNVCCCCSCTVCMSYHTLTTQWQPCLFKHSWIRCLMSETLT